MPPRRPLPELCLIAVMKMLTPNDQLKASQMSPRCSVLVRAANRRVKSLVISSLDIETTEKKIDSFFLASKPSMKQLKDDGVPFCDYPMTNANDLSKWNCLQLDSCEKLDSSTIEQIVSVFSAVTDLKFISDGTDKNIVVLLQHPQWTNQLINLMVVKRKVLNRITGLSSLLYTAINGLSALQCLALRSNGSSKMPEMPIFNQLKVLEVDFPKETEDFVRSLERHATENVDLQVHLFTDDFEAAFLFSEPLRRRIVRCGRRKKACIYDVALRLCNQFSALTSLSVFLYSNSIEPLFTALSQHSQLVHLHLKMGLGKNTHKGQPLPLVQLNSVRALDLHLLITSHSQVKWLNLSWILPNLQAIHLIDIHCARCKVYLSSFYNVFDTEDVCSRSTLPKLHSGVPHERIILGEEKPYFSLEQLLSSTSE